MHRDPFHRCGSQFSNFWSSTSHGLRQDHLPAFTRLARRPPRNEKSSRRTRIPESSGERHSEYPEASGENSLNWVHKPLSADPNVREVDVQRRGIANACDVYGKRQSPIDNAMPEPTPNHVAISTCNKEVDHMFVALLLASVPMRPDQTPIEK